MTRLRPTPPQQVHFQRVENTAHSLAVWQSFLFLPTTFISPTGQTQSQSNGLIFPTQTQSNLYQGEQTAVKP